MVTEVNDGNFSSILDTKDKLIVIDCGASWCGPCRHVAPIIEELAAQYSERAVIGKCDVDESPEIPAKYGIRNVPTVLFIKNNELLERLVGAQTKDIYQNKIEQYL